ncbi:MAG TPA: rod shape-determining protein MreC [Halanaerobiales bacterium]|nr:rod shape-determining protein MreC [Halanaerobiales bacterium]
MNNKGRLIFAAILIVLLALIGTLYFFNINISYFQYIESGIYNLVSPLIEFFSGIYYETVSYWHGLLNVDEVMEKNKRLERELASLKLQNLMLKGFQRENERLRKLLSFKEHVSFETLGSTVIGFSPSLWENKLIINRGSNDGVRKKMPVISYNGALVGRVDYVGSSSSQVSLIYDPEFVVGGIVQRNESRTIGIVKGQLNNNKMNIMEKISWDADIQKGDIIVTSGFSNNYPKGLPIGKVQEINPDNYGLSQSADIKLFSTINTIEEVLIITDF